MNQLGGIAINLSRTDTHLSRGEPIEDVARVISRMVDVVMIRTFEQTIIERFAAHSRVPVINGLTNEYHPCQILADIYTYIEHRGSISGKTVALDRRLEQRLQHVAAGGDDHSTSRLHVSTPPGTRYELARAGAAARHSKRLPIRVAACCGADLVTTDVWTSMGFESENDARKHDFAQWRVDAGMMRKAKPGCALHALPAGASRRGSHGGRASTDRSRVVWDEAENRLHAQKALLEYLVCGRVEYTRRRTMIDHARASALRTSPRAKAFYRAALAPLGYDSADGRGRDSPASASRRSPISDRRRCAQRSADSSCVRRGVARAGGCVLQGGDGRRRPRQRRTWPAAPVPSQLLRRASCSIRTAHNIEAVCMHPLELEPASFRIRMMARVFRWLMAAGAVAGLVAAVQPAAARRRGPTSPSSSSFRRRRAARSTRSPASIADRMKDRIGQPVIVENKPAAGGTVATAEVAKSAPDGYTMLLGFNGPLAFGPLPRSFPTDVAKDLAPVIITSSQPNVLAVYAALPVKACRSWSRGRRPTRASSRTRRSAMAARRTSTWSSSNPVADSKQSTFLFNGSPPAVTATIQGETQAMFAVMQPLQAQVQAGKLRALAVTTAKRFPLLPDLPTIAESGYPGFEAPRLERRDGAGRDAEAGHRTAQRRDERDPEAARRRREDARRRGFDLIGGTPEDFGNLIKRETETWTPGDPEAGPEGGLNDPRSLSFAAQRGAVPFGAAVGH